MLPLTIKYQHLQYITNTKLYVPVVNLSPQDNAKLLQQFKSGFKRTINWSKYQSKVTPQEKNNI